MAYLFLFLILFTFLTVGSVRATEKVKCYPWSEARSIIAKNNLITGATAFETAASKTPPQKVGVTSLKLCQEHRHFFFKAITVDQNSIVETVIVDAKTGYRLRRLK